MLAKQIMSVISHIKAVAGRAGTLAEINTRQLRADGSVRVSSLQTPLLLEMIISSCHFRAFFALLPYDLPGLWFSWYKSLFQYDMPDPPPQQGSEVEILYPFSDVLSLYMSLMSPEVFRVFKDPVGVMFCMCWTTKRTGSTCLMQPINGPTECGQ